MRLGDRPIDAPSTKSPGGTAVKSARRVRELPHAQRHQDVGADQAGRFRQGWRDGTPRTDLVGDDLLDAVAAAGTTAEVAGAFDRLAAAGLDVVVIRDDPAVDPEVTLRQARDAMK